MARYPSIHSGRRKEQILKWVYIASALLIVVIVVAFIYGRRPSGEEESVVTLPDINVPAAVKIVPAVPEPNLSAALTEPASEPNSEAAEVISEAMAYLNAKPARIIAARDALNEVLPMAISGEQRAFVKERLSELADRWLFSRTIFPDDKLCGSYKVKGGDRLSTIGKQFKVPYEILLEINKISRPKDLQAGETIKVINGPFHSRIYRSAFTMDLYLQNTFVRSFPVGLGKPGMETPTGFWVVKQGGKLISPTWTDPVSGKTYEAEDPDYPLGSRWIGLEGLKGDAVSRTGFAIHGTKNPEEIGTAGSQGCVRLHNGDAVLVYSLLVPRYSRVEIVE